MSCFSRGWSALIALALWPLPGLAEGPGTWTQSGRLTTEVTDSYGAPGELIDMPSAEMAPEAQISATVSHYDGTTKTTLSFQPTRWLSTSFRYSAIRGLRPDPGRPPYDTYYDRSFDLRIRLLEETATRPAVALGLRDFVGTGLFGGEYIVATKAIGKRLRLTGGLGWGRLGSHGAFASTGTRSTALLGEGGIPTHDRWFRGDVAGFAGLSYAASDRLNLKLEYSSDGYDREVRDGITRHRSPWNAGLDYKLSDTFRLSAYSLNGSELGVSATLSLNARKPVVTGGAEAAPMPVAPRAQGAARDLGWTSGGAAETARLRALVANSLKTEGLVLQGFTHDATSAHVAIRNPRYDIRAQAVGRTARVLTRTLPASIEVLTITQVEQGIPTSAVTLRRSDLERLEHGAADEILAAATFSDPLSIGGKAMSLREAYPRFDWSVGPFLRFSVFDPDSPVRANGGIALTADYHIAPGWRASGAVSVKLFGDLDDVRTVPTNLPRVRSNVGRYSATNDPTLDHLTLAHYGRPGKDLYSRVTLGYLEKMYAGASGELLWKPVGSRLALGAEINYVVPRDFDQLFGTRSHNTRTGTIPEVNGHISAYYDFRNGFHGQLDVGRYLAGDWGATVSLDRVFANGWRIGAYATKTDVSATAFGEGSFDKGIRITIPLSWGVGQPTRRRSDLVIRSLSRDGGARLQVDDRLYDSIRDTHRPEMAKSWGKFWR